MKKLILSLFVTTSVSLFAQVNVADSLALVDFYNSTDGPNWTDNSNWLSGPVSTWNGITVDSGRVTQIQFYSNNMNGSLNPSLGDLSKLEMFSLLSNSGIIGNFPQRFWELSELTYLSMFGCSLSGALSDSLGELHNLKTLNLYGNDFSGQIPDSIVTLTQLETLRFGGNDFDSIPLGIGNLTSLTYFDIANNNFSGELPDTLYSLINLTMFWIAGNNFKDTISNRIGDLTELKWIYWEGNDFYGIIPKEIGNLDKVTFIQLNSNDLEGDIPEEISDMSSLINLRLHYNEFTSIPDSLSKLKNLKELNINGNYMEAPFPNCLGKIKSLTSLYLQYNLLYGDIDTSLGNMPNLTTFNISHNNISNLPDMSLDTNLSGFCANNNALTFEDFEPNMFDTIITFKISPQANVGMSDTFNLLSGDSIQMSVSVGGTQNQYQWYRDGVLLTGEDSSVLSIDSFKSTYEGNYVCEVTSSIVTGLTISSEPILLLIDSTIVTDIENRSSKIEIYPMPFHEQAIINLTGNISTPLDLYIYDEIGRVVRVNKNITETKLELNRDDLKAGNYFIEIIDGSKIIKARFLIK